MKLVCDRCHTMYTIADAQARGPVVTLKCDKCGNTVRAPVAPRLPGDAGAKARPSPARSETGPVKPGAVRQPVKGADASRPAGGAARPTGGVGGASGRVAVPQARGLTRPLGSGPTPGRAAPAISKFASDQDGRLHRAAKPEPKRPAFGAGTLAEPSTEDGDGFASEGRTQIAAFSDLAAALGQAPEAPEEWYVSVDGDQRGPFARDALELEIPRLTGEDVFVWRDGFDDWKPLSDVPELDPELRLGPPPSSGLVRGAKSAAEPKRAPWSPAKPSAAAAAPAASKPQQTAPKAERKTGASATEHKTAAAPPAAERAAAPDVEKPAPAAVGTERSGAEVVPIESMRSRRRGGETGRGTAAEPAHPGLGVAAEPHAARAVPAASAGEPAESGRDLAAAALASADPASASAAVAAPAVTPEPESAPEDEFVVSEPSKVIRVSDIKIPVATTGSRAVPSSLHMPAVGLDGGLAAAAPPAAATPHKSHKLLMIAAAGGILASLSLAGVVAYLVLGRGPSVEVREVVRVKSPEELGAEADRAAARVLAERRFAEANPVLPQAKAASGNGAAPAANGKRPATPRPGTVASPGALVKRPDGKAAEGGGLSDFFRGPGGAPGNSNLADPSLERHPAARQVSDEEIQKAIRRQQGALNVCYNRALKLDSTLKSVRLDVTLRVGISGRVTRASISQAEYRGTFLGQCLTDAVKRWALPATGAEYATQMPVVLHAN
jgi:predicted Zn finger-like uncharacterized protein